MKGKKVSESSLCASHQMLPEDANPAGNIHGGAILKYIDSTAAVVAMRHVRGNAVTASIDLMDFLQPVYIGELTTFKASLNMVGNTSMEIGVRVEAENVFTGDIRHTASAYLTFVALDQNGRSKKVPPLILETDEEVRRNQEAILRQKMRHIEKK